MIRCVQMNLLSLTLECIAESAALRKEICMWLILILVGLAMIFFGVLVEAAQLLIWLGVIVAAVSVILWIVRNARAG